MLTFIAVGLALVAFAQLIYVVRQLFKLVINMPMFAAQIHKLVNANNIDRALKLCHAAPQAPGAQMLRALLHVANRPGHEIQFAYEAQAEKMKMLEGESYDRILVSDILQLCSWAFASVFVVFGMDFSTGALVAVALMMVCHIASFYLQHHVVLRHIRDIRGEVIRLRNALFERAEYVPDAERQQEDVRAADSADEPVELDQGMVTVFNVLRDHPGLSLATLYALIEASALFHGSDSVDKDVRFNELVEQRLIAVDDDATCRLTGRGVRSLVAAHARAS